MVKGKKMSTLKGVSAIKKYVNRSETTVMKWIFEYDFPAQKIGGIWESNAKDIEAWKKKFGSLPVR